MKWENLENITLLVAEDDRFNRKLISVMLSKNRRIRIIEARDGKEALALLDLKRMDALLLDIHMPNMNGFDTLKTIRGHELHKNLPIIVITSDDMEKSKSLALGANAFLPKPFKRNDLERQVYNALVGS